MQVELTRISEKGQVVIPSSLRKEMGIKKSDQFMVFGEAGTVILKKIETPAIKKTFDEIAKPLQQAAKLAGAVCYAIHGRYTQGQDFSNADRIFPGLEEAIRHLEGCMPHEPLPRSRWSSSLREILPRRY